MSLKAEPAWPRDNRISIQNSKVMERRPTPFFACPLLPPVPLPLFIFLMCVMCVCMYAPFVIRSLVPCSCVVLGIHVGCLEPKNYHPPPSRYGAIGRSVGEGHLTWICNYYSGLQGAGMTEMDPVFGDRRGIGWRFMVATSLSIHFLKDGTQTSKGKAILIWGWRWWDEEGTFTGL